MSKHAINEMPKGQWGYRGSNRPWRVHPPGRWWHRAAHKVDRYRETVDEILQSIIDRDERDAARHRKLLADLKREAERLACQNRTSHMHLSADGEYYCWHANLAFGPGMPQDRPFVMTIPVPEGVMNLPMLCQHRNTETVNE